MYFDFLKEKLPWSKREIDGLGEYFAGLATMPPEAAEIIYWYDELARQTAAASEEFARQLFGQEGLHPDVVSAFRVKSQSTIGEKIRRSYKDPKARVQLRRMWDFAGARLTANVLHDDLRYLAYELRRGLVAEGHRVTERDYLVRAQPGGYRAFHLVVDSAAGFVELQLRTLLQSEWANTFEKLTDQTGREIRYEDNYRPENADLAKVAKELESIASAINDMERSRAVVNRQVLASTRNLAAIPPGLPLNPRLHELRSRGFHELSLSETAAGEQASSTLNLIESLRVLSQSLSEYECESG